MPGKTICLDIKCAEISVSFDDNGQVDRNSDGETYGFLIVELGGHRIVAELAGDGLILALAVASEQQAE